MAVAVPSIMGTTSLPALARDNTAGGTLGGLWRPASPGEAPRPVTFSFHRAELGEGRISVKLAAGKSYAGHYLRLTGKRPQSRIRFFHTYWISDEFDRYSVGPYGAPLNRSAITIGQIERVNERPIVYFTKGDNLVTLNRAALYVLDNEQTSQLKVAHVYEDQGDIPKDLPEHLRVIDHLYPQLRIDFVAVKGVFGPGLVEALSRRLGVAKNYMFIGTPGDRFPHRIEDLGGVRVVL
jgi:hypothetical protein